MILFLFYIRISATVISLEYEGKGSQSVIEMPYFHAKLQHKYAHLNKKTEMWQTRPGGFIFHLMWGYKAYV